MVKVEFKVKLTPIATEDLASIYRYIVDELVNEDAASNILDQIESSIMRLKHFPFSSSFVADEFLKLKGYRKLVIGNYIAFYIVDEFEKQVVIMRVLYGRRQYKELL